MTDKELRELESLAVDQDRLFDPCAVIALIAEVRRLRCCGNCEHFDLGHDGMHIEPQCKLTTYYLEPWQKCDKWEAAGNG